MSLTESQLEELKKLGELNATGVLSDEEFAQLKAEILEVRIPSGFEVVLTSAGDALILLIREIRAVTGWDFKPAKTLVDSVAKSGPASVMVVADAERADAVRAQLQQAGATVEINPIFN